MYLDIDAVRQHINANQENYLEVWKRLVAQPSVSAQDIGIRECAELLVEIMKEFNIEGRVLETGGQPVVYGELSSNPAAMTVLFYGHYDVQPPEPFDAWLSPPFEPTIRDGRLYGRGTADNKGQLLAHLCAINSILETAKRLPVNVKFLFEGEEESGSPNLAKFVSQNKELLAADVVYASDGPMYDETTPVIKFGHRGVLSMELTLQTATQDNHSGNKGGVIPNAAWQLVHLLSTMIDRDGKITIEGFYDDVLPPDDYQLQLIDNLPFDPETIAEVYGVKKINLDKREFYCKLLLEPTLSINGLISGYTGPGSKTIIPHKATAKLDARLVVDQDAKKVFDKIKTHVKKHNSDACLVYSHSMLPSKTQADLPVCQAIIRAIHEAYQTPPVVMPSAGGSLPSYVWTKILNIPAVGVPYANPDEDNHAPNENMVLDCFYKGIMATAQAIYELGKLPVS